MGEVTTVKNMELSFKKDKQLEQYFNQEDESIKSEILYMIIQYLNEVGYHSSAQILSVEANITTGCTSHNQELSILKSALKSGDWNQAEALQLEKKLTPRFIYQINRHHFLELLTSGDSSAALQFLSTRLRPYKSFEDPKDDFEFLCHLLVDSAGTNVSIKIPSPSESLSKLIELIDNSLDKFSLPEVGLRMQNGRLNHLMQQAASLQLSCYPRGVVKSMIQDFTPAILPNSTSKVLPKQHLGPVKTLAIIPDTTTLLSGGADSNIVIWDLKHKMKQSILRGHKGRVWSIAAKKPNIAASASGDGTIKVWNLQSRDVRYEFNYNNDVYAVDINRNSTKLIGGGFDRYFEMIDLVTGRSIFKRQEHRAAITSVFFDPSGNMAVTGGKDASIKIWDLRNAIVVRELKPVFAEVSSVAADSCFSRIVGSTKNSSIRIWDLRMTEEVMSLYGHQNQSKHFVRSCFGPDDRSVLSGSDDGMLYVWGATSGKILEKFPAYEKGSYGMVFSNVTNQFVSYGEDNNIHIWDLKTI